MNKDVIDSVATAIFSGLCLAGALAIVFGLGKMFNKDKDKK